METQYNREETRFVNVQDYFRLFFLCICAEIIGSNAWYNMFSVFQNLKVPL